MIIQNIFIKSLDDLKPFILIFGYSFDLHKYRTLFKNHELLIFLVKKIA